jgi:hypothetical protein
MTWFEGSRYWLFGPLCINMYTLAGAWLSAGLHLSIVPLYADIHVGWWIVSVMSRERGEWLHQTEAEYERDII